MSRLRARGDRDFGTLGGETFGDRGADAAARARDERTPPREPCPGIGVFDGQAHCCAPSDADRPATPG
jgi:hypothetical protein